jgi:tRNA-specific 2-thiouridylase
MSISSTRVVIALSGGVDSSVAAYLLKEKGYDVLGVFMKNWHDETVTISEECPWLEDSYDAMLVAQKLNIPFKVIDLSSQYKEKIVDYMFNEYESGNTPNPDVLCNREIKFDVFLETAKQLNADFIATGHYARVLSIDKSNKTYYALKSGIDVEKDQSYFLCQLNQYQLSKSLFPIGNLKKDEVREIAKKQGLITAEKKDSQGLCFIGKVKLPDFLQQKLVRKKGSVILISRDNDIYKKDFGYDDYAYQKEDGKIIGNHIGSHFFTIGQRKGLSIGGMKEPLFILATDTSNNLIYVGEGSDHPGLYRKSLKVYADNFHIVNPHYNILNLNKLKARIRYRQALQEVSIKADKDCFILILLKIKKPSRVVSLFLFTKVTN